jgi:hypothetical protein
MCVISAIFSHLGFLSGTDKHTFSIVIVYVFERSGSIQRWCRLSNALHLAWCAICCHVEDKSSLSRRVVFQSPEYGERWVPLGPAYTSSFQVSYQLSHSMLGIEAGPLRTTRPM